MVDNLLWCFILPLTQHTVSFETQSPCLKKNRLDGFINVHLFVSNYFKVAYYGEPSMAPEIFLKAYAEATTEEFRLSDEAPKIDAKNPAGGTSATCNVCLSVSL